MKKITFASVLSLLSLATILTLSNCGSKTEPVEPSKEELLTGHTWNFDEMILTVNDQLINQSLLELLNIDDLLGGEGSFDAFEADVTFKTDKTYTATQNNQTAEGTWAFASSETQIIFDDETTTEIGALSTTNLNLIYRIPQEDIDAFIEANPEIVAQIQFAGIVLENIVIEIRYIPAN